MTPEEKALLEDVRSLVQQNNDILRSIKRTNTISLIFRVVYWVVIVGVSLGAYYFIQPYLETLFQAYGTNFSQVQNTADTVKDLFQ